MEEVLPKLIPCRKWAARSRNLSVGDIVMMVYPGSMVDDYRLCKVTKVYPDKKNIVRTVQVSYRKKNTREAVEVCKTRPLIVEDVGVQRLALLQADGEEVPTGGEQW